MSNHPPRCDSCERRIRRNHHALRLSDLLTGQVGGYYHARPGCMEPATKSLVGEAVLRFSFVHSDRCGDDQEHCDAGLPEWAA
jgi:hypothetical protein